MKRLFAAVLTVLLTVLTLNAFFANASGFSYIAVESLRPTGNEIPAEKAIATAQAEASRRQRVTMDILHNYTVKCNLVALKEIDRVWIVSLFSDALQDPVDTIVVVSPHDESILAVEETNIGYFKTILKQWEDEKGRRANWSLEDQALFGRLFTGTSGLSVPGEGILEKENATELALAALPDIPASPTFQYSFYENTSEAGTTKEFVWAITVLVNNHEQYIVYVSAVDGSVLKLSDLTQDGVG